jgi:hypothetical protein
MTASLNPILTQPLLHSLADPSAFFPSHTPILNLELRLPSISHVFRQSLLLHEHRLQLKPTSNPTAQLNHALVTTSHPSQRLVYDTLTLLRLSRDELHHPDFQSILLNANIAVTRQEEADKLLDHVGRSYLQLLITRHIIPAFLQILPTRETRPYPTPSTRTARHHDHQQTQRRLRAVRSPNT